MGEWSGRLGFGKRNSIAAETIGFDGYADMCATCSESEMEMWMKKGLLVDSKRLMANISQGGYDSTAFAEGLSDARVSASANRADG